MPGDKILNFFWKNRFSCVRLLSSFVLKKRHPFVLAVRLTDHCNMNCAYCQTCQFGTVIDFALLINFLERAYRRGCRTVILSGGEPTLYPHIFELMCWLEKHGFYIILNTNSFSIDEPRYKSILNHADELLFSYDGETAHDLLRGKGSYQKVLRAIELYSKRKNVTLSCVITKYNCDCRTYDELISLKKKYRLHIEANVVTSSGRINHDNAEQLAPSKAQIETFVALDSREEILSDLHQQYCLRPYSLLCSSAMYSLYVDVDGGIYPCINATGDEHFLVGRIDDYHFASSARHIFQCKKCVCPTLLRINLMLNGRRSNFRLWRSIFRRFIV